jgi:hypothetical protein
MTSAAGQVLQRAADLDRLLQLPGMALTPGDIDLEEWNALQILWSERDLAQNRKEK